jgi:hypothetical protein
MAEKEDEAKAELRGEPKSECQHGMNDMPRAGDDKLKSDRETSARVKKSCILSL